MAKSRFLFRAHVVGPQKSGKRTLIITHLCYRNEEVRCMVPSCQGGDGNSSDTHSHAHQALTLEYGTP